MTEEPIVTPPENPPPEPPTPPQPAYPGSSSPHAPTGVPAPPMPVSPAPPAPAQQFGPGYGPGPGWQQQPGAAPPGQQWGPPGPGWIPPQQGPGQGPAWGGRPPRQGTPTWVKVLVIVGVILLLTVIVLAWGCYSCARGCQEAVETIREGSYTISHNGETRWFWQGNPQPRDTAPPDTARDARTLAAGARIKDGIEAYRSSTGSYPNTGAGGVTSTAPGDRSLQDLLAPAVKPWPVNPWTDRPMTDDPHRGDFIYVLWDDGTYTLRIFLSTGEQDL